MKTQYIVLVLAVVAVLLIAGYGIVGQKRNSGTPAADVSNKESETDTKTIKVAPVTSSDHIVGDRDAKVVLIEYSDYQCPYCVKHYPTMEQIVKDYSADQVAWVFRHYPLPFHAAAKKAAEASEAASAQGKFWEYSALLTKNSQGDGTGLAPADLTEYAEAIGLDMPQFKKDLESGKYASVIESDLASGQAAKVSGTPATFLVANGKSELMSGALSLTQLKSKIDAALKQ